MRRKYNWEPDMTDFIHFVNDETVIATNILRGSSRAVCWEETK